MRPEGQIGLIDFGRIGTVDERTQQQLAAVLLVKVGMQDSDSLWIRLHICMFISAYLMWIILRPRRK